MIKKFLLAIMLLTAASASAQLIVGIRDNRHAYVEYLLNHRFSFKVEQSMYAEKIGYQTLRVYGGYSSQWQNLMYDAEVYFGSAYNGSYCNVGAIIKARYTFAQRVFIDGILNPHYDSGLDYTTCFYAGAGVSITQSIDILGGYTTIPEYRMSEKRAQIGFRFHVPHLWVSPRLSIATEGADKSKTLRALFCFGYTF